MIARVNLLFAPLAVVVAVAGCGKQPTSTPVAPPAAEPKPVVIAPADVQPSPPSVGFKDGPKTADELHRSFKLTAPFGQKPTFTAGDNVEYQFGMKNTSAADIAPPMGKRGGQDVPQLGVLQYRITRLGNDSKLPLTTSPKDGGYPVSGWNIYAPAMVKAGTSFLLDKRVLKTQGFPPGEYRLSATYMYPNSNDLDTKSFDFILK